ncbi:hypothetical protein HY346_02320 [Candidatus Microgenomates bacterium]|nr:hypothetical protein [Candidatus Microgenomates bacterium]
MSNPNFAKNMTPGGLHNQTDSELAQAISNQADWSMGEPVEPGSEISSFPPPPVELPPGQPVSVRRPDQLQITSWC